MPVCNEEGGRKQEGFTLHTTQDEANYGSEKRTACISRLLYIVEGLAIAMKNLEEFTDTLIVQV